MGAAPLNACAHGLRIVHDSYHAKETISGASRYSVVRRTASPETTPRLAWACRRPAVSSTPSEGLPAPYRRLRTPVKEVRKAATRGADSVHSIRG